MTKTKMKGREGRRERRGDIAFCLWREREEGLFGCFFGMEGSGEKGLVSFVCVRLRASGGSSVVSCQA